MGRIKRVSDEAILGVAREVFIERGIAASTREIARRAGVSEAVLFQRHTTKQELFFAAMVPPAIDVEALLVTAGDVTEFRVRLSSIATGMVEYFRQVVPILLPLMTHPAFDLESFARRHPQSSLVRLRTVFIDYLQAEWQKGAIRSSNLTATGLALFASLFSIAVLERLGAHGGHFDSSLVEDMLESMWAGMAPKQ